MTKLTNTKLYNQIVLVLAIALPIVLFTLPANFFDSGKSICISTLLLDRECYACGMTRGIMHLLHFDFEEALAYNKLSVIVLPALIFGWVQTIRESYKKLKVLRGENNE